MIFAVCAGYQIIGAEFGGPEGEAVPGLGLLDIRSARGERRGVGEITADVDPALGVERLTGFENHQGVTTRGPGVKPLATVLTGVGNGDGTEGAQAGRVVGTYLHGPVLARNTALADLLLGWALAPADAPEGTRVALEPLDDYEELALRSERLEAVGAQEQHRPVSAHHLLEQVGIPQARVERVLEQLAGAIRDVK